MNWIRLSTLVLATSLAGCAAEVAPLDSGADAGPRPDAPASADAGTDTATPLGMDVGTDAGGADAGSDASLSADAGPGDAALDGGPVTGYSPPLPSRGGPVLAHPSVVTIT